MLKKQITEIQSHNSLHTVKVVMPLKVILTTATTILATTSSISWFPTKAVAQFMPSIVTPETIDTINKINCSLIGSFGVDNGCKKPTPPTSCSVPLDPGTGGKSIGLEALQPGDIILSTTDGFVSKAIQRMSKSPVSHSIIYIGNGQVVEAIGDGVVLRSLGEAIQDATVAVAFRYPGITSTQALIVRDYAGKNLDKSYNYWGIVKQAAFQLHKSAQCDGLTGIEYDKCINRVGCINLGKGSDNSFFCSQLVLAAYQYAGIPLTRTPPHWSSPGDIAELSLSKKLGYIGHLKTSH